MEMAEHVCSKRIDANLLDVTMDDIDEGNITYADYKNKMERLKAGKVGRLVVKQYPTSGAGANHFRALVKELKLKKQFVPDVIIVDYLGSVLQPVLKVLKIPIFWLKQLPKNYAVLLLKLIP
ncbi:replication and recombination DNA helicase [Klebsiella phage CPRSB]|nr:replication and recombination DNA helicase [Klebsiella phage CPRSB]